MNIHGFQKLTLLDYPEHMACIIFTAACNFRCPFCHNASLVTHINGNNQISKEEILSFLCTRINILEGVCISGGEPTLQDDLINFIEEIKEMGFLVKLDTNGSNPHVLAQLLHSVLIDYVAMDIKNSPSNYAKTVGTDSYSFTDLEKSIDLLQHSTVDYEFRTTLVKELHTMEDLYEIAQLIKGCKHYYLQPFKESNDLIQQGFTSFSKEEIHDFANNLRPWIPNIHVRGIE